MEPLVVVCCKWSDSKWNQAYGPEHVNVLAAAVARNLKIPHRFVCVTDDPSGIAPDIGIIAPIWNDSTTFRKCFRRLKIFSRSMANEIGPRFVSIDLDAVITGDLTPLFDHQEPFKIALDTQPPKQYNGSMFQMDAGARESVWLAFDSDPAKIEARSAKLGYVPDDQGVITAVLGPDEKTWGPADGVLSYKNDVVAKHKGVLPATARIVFFHGHPKPWSADCRDLPWVRAYTQPERRLLVLGGASCVWDDIEAVMKAYGTLDGFKICAINDIGAKFNGRIDYWASLHPEKMLNWMNERVGNQDYATVAHLPYKLGKQHFIVKDWGGSSGLFAAKFGIEQGFEKIILCGVPMNPTPHFFGGPDWKEADAFWTAWQPKKAELQGRVFSMSGRTREFIGHPWLDQ